MRYEVRESPSLLLTVVRPDKRIIEFLNFPNSILIRTLITRTSCVAIKNDIYSTGPQPQSLRAISNPTQTSLASMSKSITSQVSPTLATVFNRGDSLSQSMMGLKRNESHSDRGYIQLVDDKISFRIRLDQTKPFHLH